MNSTRPTARRFEKQTAAKPRPEIIRNASPGKFKVVGRDATHPEEIWPEADARNLGEACEIAIQSARPNGDTMQVCDSKGEVIYET